MTLPKVPPKETYVSFSAGINVNTAESLITAMANISNARVPRVTLLLSTEGGSIMHGMNIYNVLRGMPFELTIHNVGNVDSVGNAIFQAGAKRYACPQATFMFHGVFWTTAGGESAGEKLLAERLAAVRSDQRRIADLLAERTKMKRAQIETFFLEAQTKDAAEAIALGIIDEIREVKIPTGSETVTFNFQR